MKGPPKSYTGPTSHSTHRLAFSQDSRHLWALTAAEGVLCRFRTSDGALELRAPPPHPGARAVALAVDAGRVVTGCSDHHLRVWDYSPCGPAQGSGLAGGSSSGAEHSDAAAPAPQLPGLRLQQALLAHSAAITGGMGARVGLGWRSRMWAWACGPVACC